MHMQSARCNNDVPEARPGLHPTTSSKAGLCITAKSAARLPGHKETFRLSEIPISPLALRLITAALLELCEDLF